MSQHRDLGTIERSADHATLRIERSLNATPDEVWRMLTDPGRLSGWLHAAVEIEPYPGGAITLNFNNTETAVHGEITRYEAPSTLEYTWQRADEAPSLVRFEIAPDQSGAGAQLRVTHSRLNPAEAGEVGAGWHYHLELLTRQIAGQSTDWQWPRFEELYARYAAIIEGETE